MNPLKIIHIVENLDKGAVENWLVNVFIQSRQSYSEYEWTFYCMLGKLGRLDKKVKIAGGEIIYAPCTVSNKLKFFLALRRTLQKGKYDIIHSHHDYLSGYYLPASYGIKFKKRILHIHNTDASLPVKNKWLQSILLKPLRWLDIQFSDIIVGISNDTLIQFLKQGKLHNKRATVLYYGIDLDKFEKEIYPERLRQELGIPANKRLLLFCGRMNYVKILYFLLIF